MPTVPRYSTVVDNVVQRIKPPCMTCTIRTPGCHGKCDGYKNYKMQVEEEKTKVYSAYIDRIKVDDYEIKKRVKKAKQRKR